jgi:4-hydroxybenzoate polyprenyltransferase
VKRIMTKKLLDRAIIYSRMIKLSHTLFALPFALASLVLVHRVSPVNGKTLFWIVLAMVGARSAAMGFNRLADAEIDARNPRTGGREIPSRKISRGEVTAFILASTLLFVVSAAMLSPLCFWLSFPVVGLLFFYSYTKRFTWFAHIWLGFAIGLVPMAVWVAVAGEISWRIGMLSLALLTYIAGFDILYACQDVRFDRQEGLCSIPARFGVPTAMRVAGGLHMVSILCLVSLFWLFHLSPAYFFFVGIIGVLFCLEHTLVKPDDLSRINIAFFHVNSAISVLVFFAVLSGELFGRLQL